jgi:hypothetical protein
VRRHARGIVLGRPLPSRSTLTSVTIVLVLSVVPVAVPLLVIRNDAARSLPIGPTTAPAAPASGGNRPGSEPTQANADLTGSGTLMEQAGPPTMRVPGGPTGTHVPATPGRHGIDLIVVSVSYTPTQPHTGDRMTFSAVVKNVGDTASPAITQGVGFLVDGVTVAWSGASSAPLAPGTERSYAADAGTSGPPFWVATRPGHELTAYVDDVNRLPELDENNNTRSVQFYVL